MYEEFYRLRAKPFSLSPDPRFYFASKGHSRAMAYLEYGISQEEGFIVITGDVGAGKTTIVRSLLDSLTDKPLVTGQLLNTQLDAADLLHSVCLAFGLRDAPLEKSGQLGELERFLRQTDEHGKRALLVVDEVQNLGPSALEELRMLSNFQGPRGPLLQSFLVGQPEFRATLRSDGLQQLRQRVIATFHLGPMDEPDTRAYVEYRLGLVGWQNDPTFSGNAWDRIYAYTGGIPRKINTFCDRLLLVSFLEARHSIERDDVQRVIDELETELGEVPGEIGATGPGFDAAAHAALAKLSHDLQELEKRAVRMERVMLVTFQQTRQILSAINGMSPSAESAGTDAGDEPTGVRNPQVGA